MAITTFFKGMLLGFSIAAPVGPIGVLCIRRTLAGGRLAGLVAGLGAATADAMYGLVAGLGITFVSNLLIDHRLGLGLVGGGFLCYLGVRTLLAGPTTSEAGISNRGLVGSYVSTLLLTLTNPMTILSFAAIFAGMGLADGVTGYAGAGLLVAGVFSGSALWWLTLSSAVSLLRTRVTAGWLVWINRLAGAILIGFGLWALLGRL